MPTNVQELLAAANAAVPKISPDEVEKMRADNNVLLVDVRDQPEVAARGKIKGAINVSRGMLEFRADAASSSFDKAFSKDLNIVLYCASGGRSALGGKVLKDFGYSKVYNLGAFKDWTEWGGEVEKG